MKVLGIAGWKNSGKTGLAERLIRELALRGYAVSAIKHAHHGFDIDQPGTDSHRHRAAGAREVLVSSSKRWALMHEAAGDEARLADLLARLTPVDLVIVEGFKREAHPKIETRRQTAVGPELAGEDRNIVAIAADRLPGDAGLPEFHLDDTAGIADFIVRLCRLKANDGTSA